jgi:hypothetical protein
MFRPGEIFRYNYLWARQAAVGETTGRKARPTCLVVRTAGSPANLFLFPFTSQEPSKERVALPLSEIECRRCNLNFPTWLIVDEYNYVREDETYDFESLQPSGVLSTATLRKAALLIKTTAEHKRLQAVRRA